MSSRGKKRLFWTILFKFDLHTMNYECGGSQEHIFLDEVCGCLCLGFVSREACILAVAVLQRTFLSTRSGVQ